jgi:hypothetical protein
MSVESFQVVFNSTAYRRCWVEEVKDLAPFASIILVGCKSDSSAKSALENLVTSPSPEQAGGVVFLDISKQRTLLNLL